MPAMDSLPAAVAACLVVRDPFVRHSAETRTQIQEGRSVDETDGFRAPPCIRQRHGLLRADKPLTGQGLVFIDQPPALVAEDQAVRVPLQQMVHLLFVLVEQSAGLGALRAGRCQQIAAHIHAQFGETPGEISQRGEGHDPRFRHEPAARLDLSEFNAGEDAKSHQRHQRHREENDQTFGYRHVEVKRRDRGGAPFLDLATRGLCLPSSPSW